MKAPLSWIKDYVNLDGLSIEEIARHLRKLMGLIDDEGIRPRQDLAEALVAQGDVSARSLVYLLEGLPAKAGRAPATGRIH